MQAREFLKTATGDKANLLDRLVKLLDANGIGYCFIGALGAIAYVEPLIGLELDMVIVSYQLGRFESLLANTFRLKRNRHSLEVTLPDSRLRAIVHTNPRFGDFVSRAQVRPVLEMLLPIAKLEDVFQGLVWNAEDSTRRGSYHLQDLTIIQRLLELNPELAGLLVPKVREELRALGI